MASRVNIIFCLDGTNIKDDVVKRTKEGKDGLENIQTCCLGDRFDTASTSDNTDVNILIITPSMCNEVNKYADKDFSLIFPNTEKSLLLVCDPDSERKIKKIISRSVDYAEIEKFCNSDTRGWKHLMIPTIKEIAYQEKNEPSVPCINRYLIQPRLIDSCIAEVCLVFLEEPSQHKPVKVTIADKVLATTQLSGGVYVFSPQGLSPGVHNINVMVEDEDYGSTTLEVQSDMNKLKTMVQKTLQRDPLTLFSKLLGSNNCDKEDIERELVDILQEKPFNPHFLQLIENLLQLELTDEEQDQDETSVTYPSLLHFCAANGMHKVCEWLLHNVSEDKRSWENRDGLTPAKLAERGGCMDLKEFLDPDKPRAPPPPVRPKNLTLYPGDSDDSEDEIKHLPSPFRTDNSMHSWSNMSPAQEISLYHRQRSLSSSDNLHQKVSKPRRGSVPTYFQVSGRSDSGRSTGSEEGIPFQHFKKEERHYEEINDKSFPDAKAALPRKYPFKKSRTYTEIEDLNMDSSVQIRPDKEPPYERPWDRDPIPDNIPFQPKVNSQSLGAEQPNSRRSLVTGGTNHKSKPFTRRRSLSSDTKL